MKDKERDRGAQRLRASALSPIRTVFGHGVCNLCHRISNYFGNHAKTCTVLTGILAGIYTNDLVVLLIRPCKVTQKKLYNYYGS